MFGCLTVDCAICCTPDWKLISSFILLYYIIQTNDQILHFAELGIPEACRECIIRDVMTVDQIEYDEVCDLLGFV